MTSNRTTKPLSFDDAVEVWLLHRSGWFQHRIAAKFDVNQGRISEVLKERAHRGSREAASQKGAA